MIIFAKFFGFGADQVQVNSRKESSMKALLQQKENGQHLDGVFLTVSNWL